MTNTYHHLDLTRIRQLLHEPEQEIRDGDLWREFELTPAHAQQIVDEADAAKPLPLSAPDWPVRRTPRTVFSEFLCDEVNSIADGGVWLPPVLGAVSSANATGSAKELNFGVRGVRRNGADVFLGHRGRHFLGPYATG